ncbi:hypothetical protein C7N43_21455 [Sphingobacteriales bacterium UPWRP_1]|nr:hypothetical protein B6N25_09650 [Sphingobacteriales bacterium TSM_CSS]PSJ74931.1 hypothetical protein C7N43_21455 [Sphingobacteriales bacterium UPWRP_1]
MRNNLKFFAALLFWAFAIPAVAQQQAIGNWQVYLPQTDATTIAPAGNKVYVGTKYYLYEYHIANGSVRTLSGLNGFSELGIARMAYNSMVNALVVVYNSANVDVWKDGKVKNYPDIKRSNIAGEKQVNHLLPEGEKMYLSCSFGIVVFNLASGEFEDTFVIGPNGSNIKVYQVAIHNNLIVAATENGLYQADLTNPNLAFYTNWQQNTQIAPAGQPVEHVVFANNRFFAETGGILYQSEDLTQWEPVYGNAGWCIQAVETAFNKVAVCEWNGSCIANEANAGRVAVINPDFSIDLFEKWDVNRPIQAFPDEWGNVWAADLWRSLALMGANFSQTIVPEGPYSPNVFGLTTEANRLWVANGGINYSNWNTLFRTDGFGIYENGIWQGYGDRNTPFLADKLDILQIIKHPTQNLYYLASYYAGLLTYNGADFSLYNPQNSTLQTAVGDVRCRVSGLVYDAAGNLWVSNFGAPKAISVLTAQGEWQSFTTPFITGDPPNPLTQILVDDYDQKWVVAHKNGLLVFNHGASLQSTSDDNYKLLKSGSGLGNLPTNEVTCIAKDKDGAIWVGTAKGIGVYYCPYAIFTNGCDAVKPYVEVTGYGAYLLETEVVRAIAVDGANRKWVGTENGLWLLSSDGTVPLQYFTTQNSPLLSNFITAIAINGQTGEVYIGTDRGLVSYRSDATESSDANGKLVVFPNPVRPEYEGNIAIQGLAQNANVKITDIAGNLVFETTANGGTAIWNGKDYTGKKAASGVYLIFGSNTDGSDSVTGKFMIIR